MSILQLKHLVSVAEGRILFLLTFGLCAGTVWCVWVWWQIYAITLTTAYVGFACRTVTQYFKDDIEDGWIDWSVFLLAFCYILIFVIAVAKKNEPCASLIFGGFIPFISAVYDGAMTAASPGGAADSPQSAASPGRLTMTPPAAGVPEVKP